MGEHGNARKILIIGAGAQGNVVANVLSKADDVACLLLADIDLERARETAANVASGKIEVGRVDATDVESTSALIRSGGHDLVVNTALPAFIPQVMLATLKAGTNYLDLSSVRLGDYKNLPIEQLEYEAEWKASGKTALINAGSAPGLTNIMAREGCDELDEVDAIRIRDYSAVQCDEFVVLWALPVFAIDCKTEPVIWEGGRYKHVPIFSGEEVYDFPAPLNCRGKLYLHAHEEPVTIPLFVGKPVRYCDYKIGSPEIDAWRLFVQHLGVMDETPLDMNGARVTPCEVFLKRLPRTIAPRKLLEMVESGRLNSDSMLVCEASGRKDGRDVSVLLWTESPDLRTASSLVRGTSDVSLMTSVPAATFSLMLLRGQVRRQGVVLPEMLGPEERSIFYRGLDKYGIRVRKRVTTLAGS